MLHSSWGDCGQDGLCLCGQVVDHGLADMNKEGLDLSVPDIGHRLIDQLEKVFGGRICLLGQLISDLKQDLWR